MKKTALILAVIMILSAMPCFALQFYSDTVKYGYSLPGEWKAESVEEQSQLYLNEATRESILIAVEYSGGAYAMEFLKERSLNNASENIISNTVIADNYFEANPEAEITVATKAAAGSLVNINGKKFYKYEKKVTVSAPGYDPIDNDYVLYLTVKNEWMYTFIYNSNSTGGSNKADFEKLISSLELDTVEIMINGEKVSTDTEPVIMEGRTLVPIRAIAEKMGYTVNWDGTNRKVIMTSADGGNSLEFVIDSKDAYRNGTTFALDVPAFILNDRTYLPLRAVTEAMDADVNWDGNTTTVRIEK